MKTSSEFKKLLKFLEDQNKKEPKNVNQGIDVPIVFEITRDDGGELLMSSIPISDERCFPHLLDLSMFCDSLIENCVYSNLSDIVKERLQPTLPPDSSDIDLDDDEEDLGEDEDFDDTDDEDEDYEMYGINPDLDEDYEMDPDKMEDEEIEKNVSEVISRIDQYMLDYSLDHVYILLNYNLYQYFGDIFVVDPGRCFDRDIEQYGLDFIKRVNDRLGL